jgi:hypothetical protein
VALQLADAQVFGKIISLQNQEQSIEINFKDLEQVPMVLLPNAYPVFQKYWFQSQANTGFNVSKIEAIQISIGPGIEALDERQEITLKTITLE